jgi:prepilin-type N-terminal cleavage/methylation domain-containing protein
MSRKARRGVTLIELIVTMVILAVISGVSALAVRRIDRPSPADPHQMIADTLRKVLATGQPVVLRFVIGGAPASATISADGTVIADSVLLVDRFTALPTHAR